MRNFIRALCIMIMVSITVTPLFSRMVPVGTWRQISSTAGDCASCTITIGYKAPHVIQITANNGWIGYAYYDRAKDEYRGFLELVEKPSMHYKDWRGMVMQIKLVYQGSAVSLEAYTNKTIFIATYRK